MRFSKWLVARVCLGMLVAFGLRIAGAAQEVERPHILFAIADDWGYPHAGVYGDRVVKTPTFDRVARQGVLFEHAYVSAPSCTPSRAAILTGQDHWRLGEGANLYGPLRADVPVYPDLLEQSGYFVGYTRKGWGPGTPSAGGRTRNPAGSRFSSFESFLRQRPKDQPFCFWFGSHDPHRGYRKGAGQESGMDLGAIDLPGCFPDSKVVRGDVADYYWEVQRFDREVGQLLELLRRYGELERTLVVITGDHGMPFPRGKSNLYDLGVRVPLAIRWPGHIPGGRTVEDLVSLIDLAPTFLEIAGLKPPGSMTARSLWPILKSTQSGRIQSERRFVLFGKERHVPSQEAPDSGGYPTRGIRTYDFLYLRNYRPDRWPLGTPFYRKAFIPNAWFADCDNGPTKTYMIEHRNDSLLLRHLYDLAFGKRPEEELYDLRRDPEQLYNIADDPDYEAVRKALADLLYAEQKETGDPRVFGKGEAFDRYPYSGGAPKKPGIH